MLHVLQARLIWLMRRRATDDLIEEEEEGNVRVLEKLI
jgi:hypothetical protein